MNYKKLNKVVCFLLLLNYSACHSAVLKRRRSYIFAEYHAEIARTLKTTVICNLLTVEFCRAQQLLAALYTHLKYVPRRTETGILLEFATEIRVIHLKMLCHLLGINGSLQIRRYEDFGLVHHILDFRHELPAQHALQIGRASCRERV